MAKIVRLHQIGGPDVLKIEEAPSREPGKGEAKLRVQAIGLNRAESMFMHGYYLEPTQLPASLGYEASGLAVGVGAGVSNEQIGKIALTARLSA
jgi:NADPH:quinone reductase-like Zn-dependent oxidoreductase